MNNKKLKKIFWLCLIGLLILILVTSCNFDEIIEKDEIQEQGGNSNINAMHTFEKLDYNNLSSTEKQYIRNLYSNNVIFTIRGVEVYNESITSGMLSKIITSVWPEDQIGNLIPKPEYGELDRIEYAENWINIYINNASKSDAKDYLKELKKYNFKENEKKNDGDIILEYKIYDELENYVRVRFFKESKTLEISAKKVIK